jgi:hypothetical protein
MAKSLGVPRCRLAERRPRSSASRVYLPRDERTAGEASPHASVAPLGCGVNCIRSSTAAGRRGVPAGREKGQPGEFLKAGGGESTTRFVGRSVEDGAVGVGGIRSVGGAAAGGKVTAAGGAVAKRDTSSSSAHEVSTAVGAGAGRSPKSIKIPVATSACGTGGGTCSSTITLESTAMGAGGGGVATLGGSGGSGGDGGGGGSCLGGSCLARADARVTRPVGLGMGAANARPADFAAAAAAAPLARRSAAMAAPDSAGGRSPGAAAAAARALWEFVLRVCFM